MSDDDDENGDDHSPRSKHKDVNRGGPNKEKGPRVQWTEYCTVRGWHKVANKMRCEWQCRITSTTVNINYVHIYEIYILYRSQIERERFKDR